MRISLGLDFGTSSVRAVLVDTCTGAIVAEAVAGFPHGRNGVIYDSSRPLLARQHPSDYKACVRTVCLEAIRQLSALGLSAADIRCVGVDTTGSSPLPLDRHGRPLAEDEHFKDDLDAFCWLWKDHTAVQEAEEITDHFQALPMISRCGGIYSSEWFWSKLLHCFRTNPAVWSAASTWIELCDYVPAWLTGTELAPLRSACAAGHKALFSREWGGLPSVNQLNGLEPGFGDVRSRLYDQVYDASHVVGHVSPEISEYTGIPEGIPVSVGAFDAHLGAVGAGISEGMMVKILGTSTCDCVVSSTSGGAPEIPGVCGVVEDSIVPGYWGIEAGQSAVGDIFDWVTRFTGRSHEELTAEAMKLEVGSSGLLALDWLNGNRTVLVDQRLTGLLVGLGLHTTPAEVYRAMIEATAFGARRIIEQIEGYSVPIKTLTVCGGIAEKSPLVMQIYADILVRPIQVAASRQTCALGSAIVASVAAGIYPDVPRAQSAMVPDSEVTFTPIQAHSEIYQALYQQYLRLHDGFGIRDEDSVMKQLLKLRDR